MKEHTPGPYESWATNPISQCSRIPSNRVVLVRVDFTDGYQQLGTGFLIANRIVLTAEHCTRDTDNLKQVERLYVVRSTDNDCVPIKKVVGDPNVDMAVLVLEEPIPWPECFSPIQFARVDQTHAGTLHCESIGYPLFQRDPAEEGTPETVEFHGEAYRTNHAKKGKLLIRDPIISPDFSPDTGLTNRRRRMNRLPGPWDGFSGSLLFHRDKAVGVVVEHNPREGKSAIRAVTFETLARQISSNSTAKRIADLLGLPSLDNMVWATETLEEPFTSLVSLFGPGGQPYMVRNLDPYRLGATKTNYGSQDSYGVADPYVSRTHNDVDARTQLALQPEKLVLITGPSKAGKTRTLFEALKASWPEARLIVPEKTALEALAKHPRMRMSGDPLVVWLDDLQEYLNISSPLTTALLDSFLLRPGSTVIAATLRSEEMMRLSKEAGELSRDIRLLLARATQIELEPTQRNEAEQAAAQVAYPDEDLAVYGLGEQLAGAPELSRQYRYALYDEPLLHAIIETAIDWVRMGIRDPIPEPDLALLTKKAMLRDHPAVRVKSKKIHKKIQKASTPPSGAGRVAALETIILTDSTRGYRPFSYLVAVDDGQGKGTVRPIPKSLWDEVLHRADPRSLYSVGFSAYQRGEHGVAMKAWTSAADAGETHAMVQAGNFLKKHDPSQADEIRKWYEKAAHAGNTAGMVNLAVFLHRMDPPEIKEARKWHKKSAEAGLPVAMHNFALHLEESRSPDILEVRKWYEKAANAGYIGSMYNLGRLLQRLSPPENEEARKWYEKAANRGNISAMSNLARLLQKLSPPENEEARKWYEKAANAGDISAMSNLARLLQKLSPPENEEARKWDEKAQKEFMKSAEAGLITGF